VGFWDAIRKMFADTSESRIRGYGPGRFSFNSAGGRCETCEGQGVKKIEMSFLPDVKVTCEACGGARFSPETLMVRFKGKSIGDVLAMSVDEATEFLSAHRSIHQALRMLQDQGWDRGADGVLRNRSDGRVFRIELWTTQGSDPEVSILGDMWGQLGIEGPQRIIPNAQQGDRILRQSFPGIEISARGYGDLLLTRAECETVPRAPRFDGPNRGHYCNPDMDRLIAQYRGSITRETQGRAIADLSRLYAQELPMMPLFYNLTNPAVIKGFSALADDFDDFIDTELAEPIRLVARLQKWQETGRQIVIDCVLPTQAGVDRRIHAHWRVLQKGARPGICGEQLFDLGPQSGVLPAGLVEKRLPVVRCLLCKRGGKN